MLGEASFVAIATTAKPDLARRFYGETLGLRLLEDSDDALTFDAHGAELRVRKVAIATPAETSVLGWTVRDVEESVRNLGAKGVVFERLEGLSRDAENIRRARSGAPVAWFLDPDGNRLSLTERAGPTPPGAGEDRFARGTAIRRRVLGDAHVDAAERGKTAFDADFQRFIAEGAWGSVWARPGLTLRERSMITIALLAALGHEGEVAMHARATRNTGASPQDIAEALLHVAVYAGVPAANRAFHAVKRTFGAMEEDS